MRALRHGSGFRASETASLPTARYKPPRHRHPFRASEGCPFAANRRTDIESTPFWSKSTTLGKPTRQGCNLRCHPSEKEERISCSESRLLACLQTVFSALTEYQPGRKKMSSYDGSFSIADFPMSSILTEKGCFLRQPLRFAVFLRAKRNPRSVRKAKMQPSKRSRGESRFTAGGLYAWCPQT